MARVLLCLAIVMAQLAVGQLACSRSPDDVPSSPIPHLQEPLSRNMVRSAEQIGTSPNLVNELSSLRGLGRTSAPVTIEEAQSALRSGYLSSTEQAEIWKSPEMREARRHIVEFCRRARHTSPAEGEQFLARLERLSPDEMRNWLTRYETRRINTFLQQETEQLARQLMLERALSRQEAMRQAAENIKLLRSQMVSGEHYLTHDQYAQQMRALRMMQREGAGYGLTQLSYDSMDATTDPMNPRGYARRVAGAMTLPGDLPRDDPRNYDRHAADYGEWATTRDAEPPIPAPQAPVEVSVVE